jgi:ABC-2 type transport system permease protein
MKPAAPIGGPRRFHRDQSRGRFHFCTSAKNQLQAMQMAFFLFLPSILLSGFMSPFRGTPEWARWLGEFLPPTHFLPILGGILLKSNEVSKILPNLWPIGVFLLAAGGVALER